MFIKKCLKNFIIINVVNYHLACQLGIEKSFQRNDLSEIRTMHLWFDTKSSAHGMLLISAFDMYSNLNNKCTCMWILKEMLFMHKNLYLLQNVKKRIKYHNIDYKYYMNQSG